MIQAAPDHMSYKNPAHQTVGLPNPVAARYIVALNVADDMQHYSTIPGPSPLIFLA